MTTNEHDEQQPWGGLEWEQVTPAIFGAAITNASRTARRRHADLRERGLCPRGGARGGVPLKTVEAFHLDGAAHARVSFECGCMIEEHTGLPQQPRPDTVPEPEAAPAGKVWDVAALGDNPAETWGNTLLFQLATALGEHPIDGRLLVNPDEILRRALDSIREQQQAAEGADEQEAMMLRNAEASRRHAAGAKALALREAADAVPVGFWATYGMTERRVIEGFQGWLRERADKIEGGQ